MSSYITPKSKIGDDWIVTYFCELAEAEAWAEEVGRASNVRGPRKLTPEEIERANSQPDESRWIDERYRYVVAHTY